MFYIFLGLFLFRMFMRFSPSHAWMLWVISVFTGMIAPVFSVPGKSLPLSLTDARFISYIVLISLCILFYVYSTRKWRIANIMSWILGILLVLVAYMWATWMIRDENNIQVNGFSWGWIFIITGCFLFLWTWWEKERWHEKYSWILFDAILWLVGWSTIFLLSTMMVYISATHFNKTNQKSILEEYFSSWKVLSFSWGKMSPAFEKIESFRFERKYDAFSARVQTGWEIQILWALSWNTSGEAQWIWIISKERFSLKENSWWIYAIYKDGTLWRNFDTWAIKNSFKTLGNHFIYQKEENNIKKIVYNDIPLSQELSEVREIFLQNNWSSYAFFWRPLGETKYCLFTRYRWNICGLEGYMNPRLGADGSSVIYAGLKDGTWSLYRNTDILVKNTGYRTLTTVENDYLFFDITNPRHYIFIIEQPDGKYILRKEWKEVSGLWDDVWLDISFWYDWKILMTAKKQDGWHIIEI